VELARRAIGKCRCCTLTVSSAAGDARELQEWMPDGRALVHSVRLSRSFALWLHNVCITHLKKI